MGKKLPPRELALYKRCDEVLQYIWDPIGVAGAPGARDEYEGYLPTVFKLLVDQEPAEKIEEYLMWVEADGMGMSANLEGVKNTVEVLLEWHEWLWEEIPE